MTPKDKWRKMIEKHWNGDEAAFKEWFVHIGMIYTDVPYNTAWRSWEPNKPMPTYAREALRKAKEKWLKGD